MLVKLEYLPHALCKVQVLQRPKLAASTLENSERQESCHEVFRGKQVIGCDDWCAIVVAHPTCPG